MPPSRFAGFSVAASLCLFVGCGQLEPFSHVQRRMYSISDEEIQNLQFYLSGEVVVKAARDPRSVVRQGRRATEDQGTIIAPRNTPGIATEVGSTWIRVTFREEGPGVPFAADESDSVSGRYYMAFRDEDSGKMVRVRDTARRQFPIDGTNYELVYGSTVYLMVSHGAMQSLIEKRRTVEGRRLP